MNWLRGTGLGLALAVMTVAPVQGEPQVPSALGEVMRQAQIAEAERRADDAVELYRHAAEDFPFDSRPLTAWGLMAVRYGAPDQAIELLTAALAIDAADDAARSGLAEALVDVERAQEALALYESLLSRDPLNARALAGRSEAAAQIAQVNAPGTDTPSPDVVTVAISDPQRP